MTSPGRSVITALMHSISSGAEQELRGVAALPQLAVDPSAQAQRGRVERGQPLRAQRQDEGAQRTEGVRALRQEPLLVPRLQVARGHWRRAMQVSAQQWLRRARYTVVKRQDAEDVSQSVSGGYAPAQPANHHADLPLVVDLGGVRRQADGVAVCDRAACRFLEDNGRRGRGAGGDVRERGRNLLRESERKQTPPEQGRPPRAGGAGLALALTWSE